LNFEVSCILEGCELNARLAAVYERALRRCVEVSPAHYERLPWSTRVVDAGVHLLSPVL